MIGIFILLVMLPQFTESIDHTFTPIRIAQLDNSAHDDTLTHFDLTNTFSPKQTPTPIVVIPTASASPTPSNSSRFFTSVGMYVLYSLFGAILITLLASYIVNRLCKKVKIKFSKTKDDNIANDMSVPLAENLDLPDEGTVQI